MPTIYEDALAFTLKMEGGYVNDPADRGGATMMGVTQAVYDARRKASGLPLRTVRDISPAELQNIYSNLYWSKVPGIREMSRESAMVCFDIAVNHGVGRIKQWLKEIPDADPEKLIARRRRFYAAIVKNDPSQKRFEKGWENRVKALEKAVGVV